jgi:hypothetical protein
MLQATDLIRTSPDSSVPVMPTKNWTYLDILVGKKPREVASKSLQYKHISDDTLIVTKEETSDSGHQGDR